VHDRFVEKIVTGILFAEVTFVAKNGIIRQWFFRRRMVGMKILVTERFLDHIPGGQMEAVLGKMTRFVQDYRDFGFNMAGMRHGVSVREIGNNRHGLRIFKFRVTKSDRVLFTFDVSRLRPEYRQSILFLDYVLHDEQGQVGRVIGLRNQKIQAYNHVDEEAFDAWVDEASQHYDYDPNHAITRVIDVKTMGRLLDTRDEKVLYYLNDEQYACLQKKDAPAFLFGSAGSGKTTINIYKLYLLALAPVKVAYFTYSSFLVEDAKKLFLKVSEEGGGNLNGAVEFIHLQEHLSHHTGRHQLVNYPQFQHWVASHHPVLLQKAGIGPLGVYKEIRGLIKGMVPKEWIGYEIDLEAKKVAPPVIEALERQGLAKLRGNVLELFPEKLYAAKKEFLDPFTLGGVLLLHQHLDEWLVAHKMMGRETYLGLDEGYSPYTAAQREAIYEMAMSYQEWLEASGRVDENDISRLYLKKIMDGKVPGYDYVVADEIQDLTELQTYILIKLANNRNHLLFSGDINQTIRPTYFHMGRVESMMKVSNTHLGFDKHLLVKNYRSALEVVELANRLIDLRCRALGNHKKNDYKEQAIRDRASSVFYCDFKSPADVIRLIETGLNRHYVAVVVPDEGEKVQLQQMTPIKGAIFTVEEIKGIERDYVICYNVASRYKKQWETALSGDEAPNSTYRFYFNLLYVALTRARNQLVFVETDMPKPLMEALRDLLLIKHEFEEGNFLLAEVSSENQFYQEAALYERRELYEQAINAYKLSGLDVEKEVRRCKALVKNQQGYHLEAGHELGKLGFHSLAAKCYLQAGDELNYLKALVNQGLPFEKLQERFGQDVLMFIYSQKENPAFLHRFNQIYKLEIARRLGALDRMQESLQNLNRRWQGGKGNA